MVLEDQFRNACDELKDKKESLKKNRPTPARMKADQAEIKRLENQLDKALTSYNDLQSGNKQLRKQIDVQRIPQLCRIISMLVAFLHVEFQNGFPYLNTSIQELKENTERDQPFVDGK